MNLSDESLLHLSLDHREEEIMVDSASKFPKKECFLCFRVSKEQTSSGPHAHSTWEDITSMLG